MKIIKILLIFIVLFALGFFAYKANQNIPPPITVVGDDGAYVNKVKQSDSLLNNISDIRECNTYYQECLYNLSEYHKNKLLDSKELVNNQMYTFLESKLFGTYFKKVMIYSGQVMSNWEWNP